MSKIEKHYISSYEDLDYSSRRIPYLKVSGKEEGASLWILAGCHGDEVAGIEVIHRLIGYLKRHPLLKGVIYLVPVQNIMGVKYSQRTLPLEDEDLNRNFPGKADGSYTERLAYSIFDNIAKTQPELVIDLHTDTFYSIPYVLLDLAMNREAEKVLEVSIEYAGKTGLIWVKEEKDLSKYLKSGLDKSLSGALMNGKHIPSLTFELGTSAYFHDYFIRAGTGAIRNLLCTLGFYAQEEPWYKDKYAQSLEPEKVYYYMDLPPCKAAGIPYYLVKPGDYVKVEQPIAEIKDIFGEVIETIVADRDGIILSFAEEVFILPGTVLGALGSFQIK